MITFLIDGTVKMDSVFEFVEMLIAEKKSFSLRNLSLVCLNNLFTKPTALAFHWFAKTFTFPTLVKAD